MSDCICQGNWREIIFECEPLMGKRFVDLDNKQWVFNGILWAIDDFYYIFCNMSGIHKYISCCVTLKQSGMKLI